MTAGAAGAAGAEEIRVPVVLGVVGSICTGKSLVTAELERLGARVHSADAYVHELLRQADVVAEVVDAFGEDVLGTDLDDEGVIDRRKLGVKVFAGPDEIARLEAILHPRTGARIEQLAAEARDKRDTPLLVIDAPLLIEAGSHRRVDKLLVIDAPLERRDNWAQKNRGWQPGEIAKREKRLLDMDEKKRMADFTFENNGTPDALLEQARRLWRELT